MRKTYVYFDRDTGTSITTYDDAGQPLSTLDATHAAKGGSVRTLTYDAAGRITQTHHTGGLGSKLDQRFSYDGLDRLTSGDGVSTITRASDNTMIWRWDNAAPCREDHPDESPAKLEKFTDNPRFPHRSRSRNFCTAFG